MCGICGIVGLESTDEAAAILSRMMNAMVHRGPDAEGSLAAPGAALGMRRLSIIDIAGGNQPVWNEEGTLAVVFNGEIYNFEELRSELAALGHRFASRSDTEVIVHAYEAWGEECVRRFHGMFAFALVEMPRGTAGPAKSVFIARDALGVKPLYYALSNGTLLFASELCSLVASGLVTTQVSADSVAAYLLFGSVSEPASLVDDVFSLPPGHSIRISATRPASLPCTKSFGFSDQLLRWAAEKNGSASVRAGASPAKQVRTLLDEAVRKHLVADVPVGVFLSSGLDSTALAALASRVQKGIHTFTVAFPDLAFSEAEIARRTAERLGTQHQELTLSSEEMLTQLDEAICGFDQPSMDGINTYFVSWAAHQAGLKVALSGLGSDELFGGYSTFRDTRSLQKVVRAARLFPKSLRGAVARMAGGGKLAGGSPDAAQKALAAWRDSASLPDEYFFTRLLFTPKKVAEATHTDASAWRSSLWWQWLSDAVKQSEAADDFTKVSWLELRSYMANTLLRDTDATSMHHSLEVRVPFLDLPLVEYVLSLSAPEKGVNKRPKWLLVEALGDVLPPETIAQRKRTFTFPWDNWLRGALRKRVSEGLADWSPVLAAHIDRDFVLRIWEDFQAGRTSWSRPWSLFVLNEWAKRHLAASAPQNTSRQNAGTARVA
jgi:asparagine synthase (glutamine-hydrolysing)